MVKYYLCGKWSVPVQSFGSDYGPVTCLILMPIQKKTMMIQTGGSVRYKDFLLLNASSVLDTF
jgi:hypothetical protein